MIKPYLSVIIPAYNEGARMDACLRCWQDYLWNNTHMPYELIVVCNGCTDDTVATAVYWQDAIDPIHIRTIVLPDAGKGQAVRAGMLAAEGQYFYMADVDLAVSPQQVQSFLNYAVDGWDIVIGSRRRRDYVQQSWKRRLAGRLFHLLTRKLVHRVYDTQCGFKMFRAEAGRVLFKNLTIPGYAFDVEILHNAQRIGYSIHELPVYWEEGQGSKVRLVRDSLRMAGDILRLQEEKPQERRERPVPA